MVVLRIKEYENGDVCLEYRTTRRERGVDISSGKVSMVSYHYSKLGIFTNGGGIIIGSTNPTDIDASYDFPTDIDASYDLIKTLSEVGERSITGFTIELAINSYDGYENIGVLIEKTRSLFCLSPENMVIVSPGFN